MSESEHIQGLFRLSPRLAIEIIAGPNIFSVVWEPDLPEDLTSAEHEAYKLARNLMLERLRREFGVDAAIVELKRK